MPARPAQGQAARARPAARLLEPIDTDSVAGLRDRARLLLALRRSELVAVDTEDLEHILARRLLITIRVSKAAQEQAGTVVAVPYARGKRSARPTPARE